MYIYHVINQKKVGEYGILVLANNIKEVKSKYTDCIVERWMPANKLNLKMKSFADDLTGTTDKSFKLK
jgi:hypothetical protein